MEIGAHVNRIVQQRRRSGVGDGRDEHTGNTQGEFLEQVHSGHCPQKGGAGHVTKKPDVRCGI
jgi:hypothetical protein